MHYLDEGPPNGSVVVLLHGEPSWSFLYRTMIPTLTEAGYRVIAPDLIGFGKSDKPVRRADHSYERHVEWTRALLFDRLDLEDVTLFAQDWGGLIGLRLVAEHGDRFSGPENSTFLLASVYALGPMVFGGRLGLRLPGGVCPVQFWRDL